MRASSATRVAKASASTTSETRPQACASAAVSFRFDVIHSNARAKPSRRWTNHEPPESGTRPIPMKPGTNVAASEAIRMSQAAARESPAPAHGPFTDAITGFSSARMARMFGWYVRSSRSWMESGISWNSFRSWPEQKPRPAPVITTARISGLAACSSASRSAAWSAALKALKTSGRLSVIVRTAPSRSVSTSLTEVSLTSGKESAQAVGRLGRDPVIREGAAPRALQQADFEQLLQVVAHRRLREPELRLELADAAGRAGPEEHAQDPHPIRIGQRAEQRRELRRLRF